MREDKFFPTLAGTPLDQPLTRAEKDAMWERVQRGLCRRRPPRRAARMLGLVAAAAVLSLGAIFLLQRHVPRVSTPEPLPAAMLATADPLPMIDSWEGAPSVIYETEREGVKVAFVVDAGLQWE